MSPRSAKTKTDTILEVIDGQLDLLCNIEQPSHSSVEPRTGPCHFEQGHDGPCSWAVA